MCCPVSRSTDQLSAVCTASVGTQDEFGMPVSMLGHLGSVALFDEALTDEKVRTLFALGKIQHFRKLYSYALVRFIGGNS